MTRRAVKPTTHSRGNTATGRRPGFVLVMTLILIAVTALMLVGLARQSLLLAMEAVEAQDALQERWAVVSLQQQILKRADDLFAEQDRRFREREVGTLPPGRVEATVPLGGRVFQITLADEDAKINLNTVFRRQDRQRAATMVLAVCEDRSQIDVRLRPYRVNRDDDGLPAFDSWGQVFSLDLDEGVSPMTLARATEELTCWGSGRLNIARASDKSVEQVCRLAVAGSTIQRLLEFRRTTANVRLNDLLPRLQLRESELEDLRELLADEATCYSLWVHGSENSYRSSSLHVAHVSNGRSSILSFGM